MIVLTICILVGSLFIGYVLSKAKSHVAIGTILLLWIACTGLLGFIVSRLS